MADLNGSTISSTYSTLLKLNDNGTMPTDTVEAVTDGRGTSSSLSLSAQRATITLGSGAADDFIVDGTTLVVEGDNNKVGIGTAAPTAAKFHVLNGAGTAVGTQDMVLQHAAGAGSNAIMSLIADDAGESGFFFGDMSNDSTLTDEDIGKIIYDHSDNSLRVTVNTAECMRIDSSGKVGIGITSPNVPLSIKGTTQSLEIVNTDFNNSTSTGSRFLMGMGATSGNTYSWMQAQDAGGTSNDSLILQRYGGNVGIGTTDPDVHALLHLYGTADNKPNLYIEQVSSASNDGGNIIFRLKDSDTDAQLQADKVYGDIVWQGYNDNTVDAYQNACLIRGRVPTGDTTGGSSTDMPGELAFYTTPDASATTAERMVIKEDGKIGIGAHSPAELLEVEDQSGNCFIQVSSGASNNAGIKYSAAGTMKWQMYNAGGSSHDIVIQDADGDNGAKMDQNDTDWESSSDERMKQDLVELTGALDKLNTLRCVNYKMKHNVAKGVDKLKVGLIAQDVYKVYPEATSGSPDAEYSYNSDENVEDFTSRHTNAMGLKYTNMIAPIIKAIQELSAKVTALENA